MSQLGDFIYEYSSATYPAPKDKERVATALPLHNCRTLSDYRLRYATYRSDASLQVC